MNKPTISPVVSGSHNLPPGKASPPERTDGGRTLVDAENLISLIKPYLKPDSPKITNGSIITYEVVGWMRSIEHGWNDCQKAFAQCEPGSKWMVEAICGSCADQIGAVEMSKTRMFEYIFTQSKVHKPLMCPACAAKENERRNKAWEERNARVQASLQYDMQGVFNLLVKGHVFNEDVDTRSRIDFIRRWSLSCCGYIQQLKDDGQIDYHEYIASDWWKVISRHAKYKAKFRCQLCGSKEFLNTHHRTYDNLCLEMNNMSDLIVLCNACHELHHEGRYINEHRS